MLVLDDIRTLTLEQAPEAGRVMARAFYTNPTMLWALPDAERRAPQLDWLMTAIVRLGCKYGLAHAVGDPIEAASVWYPPERATVTLAQMLGAGFAGGPFALGLRFLTVLRSMAFLDKMHHRAEPGPHFYLHAIGVEPARQRQGLGSRLMKPVLRHVDAQRHRCYLETDKPEDVAFYEKHGFQVNAEFHLPPDGPKGWTMNRPAATGA